MRRPNHPDRTADELLDGLLVLRAREGSRKAFALLAERWQERLWRHARRFTHSDEAAWDVLQEVWLAVARGIRGLRDPAAFRCWAYQIVSRRAASRVRSQPRERSGLSERISAEAAPSHAGADDREDAVRALRCALARLAAAERALVELYYLEGLDVRELSQVLDVPEGTVKSRLHACRRKLRDSLERMER